MGRCNQIRRGSEDALLTPDIVTSAGYVLPGETHERYLNQQRRKRRRKVQEALAIGATGDYSEDQLRADGWGPRQIERVRA